MSEWFCITDEEYPDSSCPFEYTRLPPGSVILSPADVKKVREDAVLAVAIRLCNTRSQYRRWAAETQAVRDDFLYEARELLEAPLSPLDKEAGHSERDD